MRIRRSQAVKTNLIYRFIDVGDHKSGLKTPSPSDPFPRNVPKKSTPTEIKQILTKFNAPYQKKNMPEYNSFCRQIYFPKLPFSSNPISLVEIISIFMKERITLIDGQIGMRFPGFGRSSSIERKHAIFIYRKVNKFINSFLKKKKNYNNIYT